MHLGETIGALPKGAKIEGVGEKLFRFYYMT